MQVCTCMHLHMHAFTMHSQALYPISQGKVKEGEHPLNAIPLLASCLWQGLKDIELTY